ncbi:DUF86 domain-containing protein [Reyranella sp.]|uniref:HepT-like ribonuclease domain-containing protein n=1 Tax=Reyranella sp. TaxID=1929291 RepID=UPI003BAC06BC
MPRDRSADLLNDILGFIDRIERWTPANPTGAANADERTLYAVLHALQYIGEAVSRLPPAVIELAPQIPWARIRAMRNLIAHDYAGIEPAIVWQTVAHRLPELRGAVEDILKRLPR